MFKLDTTRWHPVAAAADLPFRHVFHAQLGGRELAVWRADDGFVNVWENRCLHRGVRLSIGINDGRELKCQYHGWRYANRTAGCTYIPAHPADAPARTIANRSFPAVERYGLIWTAEEAGGTIPEIGVSESRLLVLRALPLNAAPALVQARLPDLQLGAFEGVPVVGSILAGDEPASADEEKPSASGERMRCHFFIQPVDGNRSVVRGVLDTLPGSEERRIALLRHLNERLSSFRAAVEQEAAQLPAQAQVERAIEFLAPELGEMPAPSANPSRGLTNVRVRRKWDTALNIAGFELEPISGTLPTLQPGAHIDVHLPNGQKRQYSVVNGPGEADAITIGVKLEPDSRGGSLSMHTVVREGDVLAISEPRNNFPLRRNAVKTLFIAGGIGVTPLISMAQTLHHQNLQHEFHYFAQEPGSLAFQERLAVLGDVYVSHLGLGPAETQARLDEILSRFEPGMHVYLCGPGAMLEAARNCARRLGWPDDAVHFEYFKNTNEIDSSSSFEIALARSALTLEVPAGKTILEVVRTSGIEIPSSCEQGACGTCLVTVVEGVPNHQDVYLTQQERESGTKIMTCVSRAHSKRLVLDL